MSGALAIMFTMTTYGTWLRGDARGWVDKGIVFPPDPVLQGIDRMRMKHPVYQFDPAAWHQVGQWLGRSLIERLGLEIGALYVGTWHVHAVIRATEHPMGAVAKCAKDAVRWGLRPGRPIWGDDYDKRYCYDEKSVRARVDYVQQHNLALGRPEKPWPFIAAWEVL
jgi:hypothetical protein